jgi:DNA-binding NarL/FixJ family response regulator
MAHTGQTNIDISRVVDPHTITPRASTFAPTNVCGLHLLSPMQTEVLLLLQRGFTPSQISLSLGHKSNGTVVNAIEDIKRKLV